MSNPVMHASPGSAQSRVLTVRPQAHCRKVDRGYVVYERTHGKIVIGFGPSGEAAWKDADQNLMA